MEELMNIFEKAANIDIRYVAVYDPFSRKVTSVGPETAFLTEENKILINKEIAIDIIESKIPMSQCSVDESFQGIEFNKNSNINYGHKKLFRIPEINWFESKKSDIHITYSTEEKKLKIELNSSLGGTNSNFNNISNINKIEYFNNNSLSLEFFVTDYNDPNVVYEKIKFDISQLKNNFIEKELKIPVKRFSFYALRGSARFTSEIK